MCLGCFPGFCSECRAMCRFACCTRFKKTETKEAVVFTANIPGLTVDEVQVGVEYVSETKRKLRIIGERKNYKQTFDGSTTNTESSNARFVKFYKLPSKVLAEEARAHVDENGVLTIIVPKEI